MSIDRRTGNRNIPHKGNNLILEQKPEHGRKRKTDPGRELLENRIGKIPKWHYAREYVYIMKSLNYQLSKSRSNLMKTGLDWFDLNVKCRIIIFKQAIMQSR